jgi:uncharacterized glyoxalase superfamily protein PhnB
LLLAAEQKESAMSLAMPTRCTTIPCLSYRDAHTAIRWLCDHLGFEKKAVYEDDRGRVMHAELTFGAGMIMVGSADKDSEYARLIVQPGEIGARETQTPYLVASDPDEIYRRAKAAGAKILIDIKDNDYGGRGFTCADPEGHVWNIGSYDPWK